MKVVLLVASSFCTIARTSFVLVVQTISPAVGGVSVGGVSVGSGDMSDLVKLVGIMTFWSMITAGFGVLQYFLSPS